MHGISLGMDGKAVHYEPRDLTINILLSAVSQKAQAGLPILQRNIIIHLICIFFPWEKMLMEGEFLPCALEQSGNPVGLVIDGMISALSGNYGNAQLPCAEPVCQERN